MYETVPELHPLGVGINVLLHAVRELTGVGPCARIGGSAALRPRRLCTPNKHGQEIAGVSRAVSPQGTTGPNTRSVAAFSRQSCCKRSSPAWGQTPCGQVARRLAVESVSGAVTLRGTDGKTFTAKGDIAVAADGIHSALRRQFYPNEGPPIWNGRVLWRSITRATPFLDGRTMIMAGHQDVKFVCYPIEPAVEPGGTTLINWIAELSFPKEDGWRREDWKTRHGRLEDFLPRYATWRFPWLDVPALIRDADTVFEYPLVDRDPIDRWTFGRTTLIGDAAHPMYPIGSNGASQAILDARTLAYELAAAADPDAALARYEANRRPATNHLVLLNRSNGPGAGDADG